MLFDINYRWIWFKLQRNGTENGSSRVLLQKDCTGAVVRSCSVKKVFLEISQSSQENTCARDSFLIKLQVLPLASLVL